MNKINSTITLDLYSDGSIDVWSQEKERLTPEARRRLERLKKAVLKLIKEQPVQMEIN